MAFDEARIEGTDKKMTLGEIKSADNLEEIRSKLMCPTKGCEAHLCYTATRNPYLKRRNGSVHSKFCDLYEDKMKKTQLVKKRQMVIVTLNEDAAYSRLNNMTNVIFPERQKVKRSTTKKTPKAISETRGKEGDGTEVIGVVGRNGQSIGALEKVGKKVSGPHVPGKDLNEFIESDIGRSFKVPAILKKVIKKENNSYLFIVSQIQGNVTADVTLGRNFFSRNIPDIDKQLDFLSKYLLENDADVRIGFLGNLKSLDKLEFELIHDYDFKIYMRRHNSNRRYTLLEFYYNMSKRR